MSERNAMKKVVKEAEVQTGQDVALFQENAVRRTWHNGQWWFSVVDIVAVLTESTYANRYWSDLKRRLDQESGSDQPYAKIVRLKLRAPDGKERETDCANTETLLRIIQSIPSPKAEPFKRWLAKVGYERIQEIENPELASIRARELYEAKGYPKAWIEKRLRSIAIRSELTEEWKQRGVQEGREYAILTSEIASATFGVTPEGHKKIKGLAKLKTGDNLRDHMTDLELIFTMLGEASTTEIARRKDARGFTANRRSAREGGTIAGNARKALEAQTGRSVVSASNHLHLAGPSTAIARDAFIETPTEALTKSPADKPAVRRKVAAKVAKTIAELEKKPAPRKKA